MLFCIFTPVFATLISVLKNSRARSVAVNTPPCHGGDRRFDPGRARHEVNIERGSVLEPLFRRETRFLLDPVADAAPAHEAQSFQDGQQYDRADDGYD